MAIFASGFCLLFLFTMAHGLLCQTSKFLPGDRVWYRESGSGTKQGKFIVVKGPSAGKYYLAAIDNVKVLVLGGKVVGENELEGA